MQKKAIPTTYYQGYFIHGKAKETQNPDIRENETEFRKMGLQLFMMYFNS